MRRKTWLPCLPVKTHNSSVAETGTDEMDYCTGC